MDEKCFGVVLHPQYMDSVGGFILPYLRRGPDGLYMLGRNPEIKVDGFLSIEAEAENGTRAMLFIPSVGVVLMVAMPQTGVIGFGSNAPLSAAVVGGA